MELLKANAKPSIFGYGLNVEVNPLLKKSWTIGDSLVFLPSLPPEIIKNKNYWMDLALKQPRIDVDAVGAGLHFKEMVIYEPGGHYARHRHLMEEPGGFYIYLKKIQYLNVHMLTCFFSRTLCHLDPARSS